VRLRDRLLLSTDGVTDAMNPSGERFGRKRLIEELEAGAGHSIEECIGRIRHALDEHCEGRVPADDITLLALEIAVGPGK